MTTPNLLTVSVIAAGCVVVSQLTLAGANIGNIDRPPLDPLVSHHPMVVMDAPAQPHRSAGLHYTDFFDTHYTHVPENHYVYLSEQELLGLDRHHSKGAIDRLRLDLAVAQDLMLDGLISYADISPDAHPSSDTTGKANRDPKTIGSGSTYHF